MTAPPRPGIMGPMKTPFRTAAFALLAAILALAPLPVLAQAAPPVPAPKAQATEGAQATQDAPTPQAAPVDETESPLTLLMGLGIGLALGGALAALRRRSMTKTPKHPRRKDLLR